MWRYFFEDGSRKEVVKALCFYHNTDGGFGHALEPDSTNPNSTPYTTAFAVGIMEWIGLHDIAHPLMAGALRYFENCEEQTDYGWLFSTRSNDAYACAPWWNYNEEANPRESIGLNSNAARGRRMGNYVDVVREHGALRQGILCQRELVEGLQGDREDSLFEKLRQNISAAAR